MHGLPRRRSLLKGALAIKKAGFPNRETGLWVPESPDSDQQAFLPSSRGKASLKISSILTFCLAIITQLPEME